MTPGIYHVKFASNQNSEGWGVVTVENGRLHGGDMNYLYKGRFQVDAEKVTAKVHVASYTGKTTSIFGPYNSFDLNLTGTATTGEFNLSGYMEGQPGLKISIGGSKKSDLA